MAVYATLPFGPAIWRSLRGHIGSAERWAALAVAATIGAALLWNAAPRLRRLGGRGWLLLLVLVAAYIVGLTTPSLTPAEKTHFLYYGALAWLAHRALALDLGSPTLEIGTVLLVSILGLGDEAIQHMLPRRFFEWKDVGLNALSAALGAGLIVLLGGRKGGG